MPKRKYTYKFIKTYVESVDYVLLLSEEEYQNVKTPLLLRCPNGHAYTTQWGHFYHREHRCKSCRKLSLDYVKKSFCSEGYVVLDKHYANSTTKLRYKCPFGHYHKMSWASWRLGKRCPECVKTSFEEIVEYFYKFGYKVISKKEDYKKSKYKFKFICPKGHQSSMNWHNFKHGCRCGKCAPNKKKEIKEIKEAFKLRGYTLLSEVYNNEKEDLHFICPNGHKSSMTWSNFNKKQECAKCRGSMSKLSQAWLDALNVGTREYRLKGVGGERGVVVDGFDPETNTVYEFLGDFWHGNPKVFSADEINSVNKIKFGQLYQEWLDRKSLLEKVGYKVVYIWESDF